jgi:hypothetical protein
MQELDGVDRPVILFRLVRPELGWSNHHLEVLGKCNASSLASQRSRGMHSMPRRSGIHSVIVVVEVAMPLVLSLDAGAAIFS